jgi:hypothetical protein
VPPGFELIGAGGLALVNLLSTKAYLPIVENDEIVLGIPESEASADPENYLVAGDNAFLAKNMKLYEHPDTNVEEHILNGEIIATDHVLYIINKIIDGAFVITWYYVAYKD